MRISSVQMMGGYLKRLNDSYEEQTKLFEQSDGSSLHRPSDDSVRYSKYLRYENTMTENVQYNDNVKRGYSWMDIADKALVNITDLQQTIMEKTVQCANDTNNEMNCNEIAKEVYAYIQQIVALGNDQQGDRYLFGGQSDLVQPFLLSESESDWVDRGLAKTLDDSQKLFFNDADDNGNVTQMLTIVGSNGQKYYLNTLTHNIYDADFVDGGYKSLVAKGQEHVLAGDEKYTLNLDDGFSVASYFKNTGEIRTSTTYSANNGTAQELAYGKTLTDASGNALGKGDTFTADSAVTVYDADGNETIIKAGETYKLAEGEYAVAGATLAAVNTSLLVDVGYTKTVDYSNGTTVSSQLKAAIKPGMELNSYLVAGNNYTFDDIDVTVITADGTRTTYSAGSSFTFNDTDKVCAGSDEKGSWAWADGSTRVRHPDYSVTYTTDGSYSYDVTVDPMIPGEKLEVEGAGTYKFTVPITVNHSDGTVEIVKAGADIYINDDDGIRIGVEEDPFNIYGKQYIWPNDSENPPRITFNFETINQPIATYHGDAKYISMVKRNGLIDPTADTVNTTGQDMYGSDIFDNVNSGNQVNGASSGVAAINDLLTVYAKMRAADTHWLTSDGVSLSDAAHQTTVDAEAKVASRQQVYEKVDSMLQQQNTIITQDITDVSGADIAKLAVQLMTAQTIYNMSLSVGSRILPPTLADYL